MSDFDLFLFFAPLALALAACSIRILLPMSNVVGERRNLNLTLLVNYGVANVYFVFCWLTAEQWRLGLKIASAVIVASLVVAMVFRVRQDFRRGEQAWESYLLAAAAILLALPISAVTWLRSA